MGEFVSCMDCLCDRYPFQLPFGGCFRGYRQCCSFDGREGYTVKSIREWCPSFDHVKDIILKKK